MYIIRTLAGEIFHYLLRRMAAVLAFLAVEWLLRLVRYY